LRRGCTWCVDDWPSPWADSQISWWEINTAVVHTINIREHVVVVLVLVVVVMFILLRRC
jgi:hypothetical protein